MANKNCRVKVTRQLVELNCRCNGIGVDTGRSEDKLFGCNALTDFNLMRGEQDEFVFAIACDELQYLIGDIIVQIVRCFIKSYNLDIVRQVVESSRNSKSLQLSCREMSFGSRI